MIRKLITEMDSVSHLRQGESGSDLGGSVCISYGREGDKGVLSSYAYFFGKCPLDVGEKHRLQFIYVKDEKGGRSKLFIRGELNPQISGGFLELIKRQTVVDLMNYFAKVGHKGFAPLMKYSFDINHKIARNDFVDVLRECGFNVPGRLFRGIGACNLICKKNDSEICILYNDQLMTVIDRDGELTAYLADCHIVHSQAYLLKQPPTDNPPREYADVLFCNLDLLMDDWNDYVRTL